MQGDRRPALQAVRHEMVGTGRGRHPDPALPGSQRPLGTDPHPTWPDNSSLTRSGCHPHNQVPRPGQVTGQSPTFVSHTLRVPHPSGFVGAGWQDAAMRYSVNVPNFGEVAAPEVFAEVARRAEEAGWDALLVWDHVVGEKDLRWEIADPWILLAAAALATSRIRLGTAITPVAPRPPSKPATEGTTPRPP